MVDPVAVAVPFLFAMIFAEALYARVCKQKVYRFNDAITDLGCGVTDQVGAAFLGVVHLASYTAIWDRFHAFDLGTGPLAWLVGLFGVDLGYYLWHRASHRINFIWGTHVVHHQSDEYNLAVALRQAVFAGLTSWPFYLWLALLGVPPIVFAGCKSINLLYQFWIHTRVVGKLGPIEWIMNTPSHHRVHHGTNRAYVDKNYAGVFIIWDRMFGTFIEEDEEPRYGTIAEYGSWNPVWAQFAYYEHLLDLAVRAPRPLDKLKVWFAPPEWMPEGLESKPWPSDAELRARPVYDPDAPRMHPYILLQWVPVAILTTAIIGAKDVAPLWMLAVGASFTLTSLIAFGAMLERKPWAQPLEYARLATGAVLGGAGLFVAAGPLFAGIPAIVALGSAAWFRTRTA